MDIKMQIQEKMTDIQKQMQSTAEQVSSNLENLKDKATEQTSAIQSESQEDAV